ncbi:MAG: T9SS type A sorting domain-containing protein [Bacteroidales bacterium]|jgi:hypothetical protein|nr:T9SS type A sorting domain-containing protein [Bacteroidales bacterium]
MVGQIRLTGLYKNEVIEQAHRQSPPKQQKSTTFIEYEPISIPFIDDFSNYIGYPSAERWLGKQAFINQSFAVNPPTIGCATLDALDEKGRMYAHASSSVFGADTLLSRPIRLDSIFLPYPRALLPADSVKLCFFYQPGGGEGQYWEGLGVSPDVQDSLVLELGYQTGNITLLYYTNVPKEITDTISPGDTLWSSCNSNIYIIAQTNYYPGDTVDMPCDSVTAMEVIWNKVWASEGMTLKKFKETYNTDFRQVMIPITDDVYFNKGFQFRFRNYASLGGNNAYSNSNTDYWNIDYVRLDKELFVKDTAIDDVSIVDNPGSMLEKYTSMPWNHFKDNKSAELKTKFDLKLINLDNVLKNTSYYYTVFDRNSDSVGGYSGGSENLKPFFSDGYQDYAPHANPPSNNSIENTINFPSASSDSVELTVVHVFRESGSGDQNPINDTVRFYQKFHNYFAYDDGTPEWGLIVTTPNPPYHAALGLQFTLNKADTLQAIDMYVNHLYNDASDFDFTLTVWDDDNGLPGDELYRKLVSQHSSSQLYGFQRFYIDEPLVVSGTFYIGYQTSGNNFLNIGFDQNKNNSQYLFCKATGLDWEGTFIAGSAMMRPVTGKRFPHTSVAETKNTLQEATIYPNPAKDKLHIMFSENTDTENIVLSIYSVTGQKIYESKYSPEIILSNYPAGFYLLRLVDTKHKKTSAYKFSILQ